jgi:molybdate transport system ATP-binding protein
MHPLPAVAFKQATIVRSSGEIAFQDLTWTIHEGETWCIVGPVGAGKTTLAEAMTGRMRAEGIEWPFIERLRLAGRNIDWPSQVIHRVSFKEESRLFSYSRHYYQQRFNFIEPGDDLTLDQFLRAGPALEEAALHAICVRLGIEKLRDLSLIKLSNGQTRRARIARALLHHPEMLILDEPFLGLDAAGRAEVAIILGELVRGGLRVVLITRPESVPAWVTHVLELDRHEVRRQGTREDVLGSLTLGVAERSRLASWDNADRLKAYPTTGAADTGKPIVEMRQVNVGYDGRPILHDINWTVRQGERWALLGPNGSGKSTLLSLIAADHPQAYSNDIYLFGQKRGSGESIWDIKRHVGLVSPEMHFYFSEPLTAFRAAATGFFDVLAYRPTTPAQDESLRHLFDFFELTPLAERPFSRLSTGEQRLVLLMRALVKAPPLLILDEPFQGLDGRLVAKLRDWLDEHLSPEQALIFVTHWLDEVPRSVTRILKLEEGRIAS